LPSEITLEATIQDTFEIRVDLPDSDNTITSTLDSEKIVRIKLPSDEMFTIDTTVTELREAS
jgi:hypothetical protein